MPPEGRVTRQQSFNEELLSALKDKSVAENIINLILPELVNKFKLDILNAIENAIKSNFHEENQSLQLKINQLAEEKLHLSQELEEAKAKLASTEPSNSQNCSSDWPDIRSSGAATFPRGQMAFSVQPNQLRGSQSNVIISAPHRVIMQGRKSQENCKIRGVKPKLNLMISRLDLDTSQSELEEHLKEMGVVNPVVKKLAGYNEKTNYTYKTSAFSVQVDPKFRDRVLNVNNWPEDCLVREWMSKRKMPTLSQWLPR